VLTLLTLSCVSSALTTVGPSDEMQKFIDECNYMIDEMNHCAQGWVNLEKEMIASVDSFADKIVYTESLIMEETALILDMADRIVQTEEIMVDLVESCDCSTQLGWRNEGVITHEHEYRNKTKTTVKFPQTAKFRSAATDPSQWSTAPMKRFGGRRPMNHVTSNETSLSFDKCSVMDEMIEVMDACIDAFVVYNDDFLQVLSYMDVAIQDMGARIVNTECLIVNMSYQIGDMADLIVDTEVLMADMMATCCRGNNEDVKDIQHREKFSTVSQSSLKNSIDSLRASTGDDDLLTDCDFDGFERRKWAVTRSNALKLTKTAHNRLREKLDLLPPVVREMDRSSHLKRVVLPALSQNTPPPQDMMPCDTWWDPFCCAAEVCADIMVEMIEMMADGADWMEGVCESCIDEIGALADDIVKTEENIVLMGYAINDMADYIVIFISEGLDFMTYYCPKSKKTYSLRGNFKLKDVPLVAATNLLDGGGMKFKSFMKHMNISSEETFTRTLLPEEVSQLVAKQLAVKAKIEALDKFKSYYTSLQDNPFGEFAAMVDVMMEAMRVFTDILSDQTHLMTELFEGLVSLSSEQAKMAGLVVSMGGDVATMGVSVQEEISLMQELDDCIFND